MGGCGGVIKKRFYPRESALIIAMNTIQIMLLVGFAALSMSIGVTVFLIRRQSRSIEKNLLDLADYINNVDQHITDEIPNIKRAHSLMGTLGNVSREAMKAESALIMDAASAQLGIDTSQALDLIRQVSPRAADIIDKNPEVLTQLAPKILEYINMHKDDTPQQATLTGPSRAWT